MWFFCTCQDPSLLDGRVNLRQVKAGSVVGHQGDQVSLMTTDKNPHPPLAPPCASSPSSPSVSSSSACFGLPMIIVIGAK